VEQGETSTPNIEGHDGPYGAPIDLPVMTVLPEWIDYNGHMNVAFYTKAFDMALDRLVEDNFGIGEAYARDFRMGPYAVQMQIHYEMINKATGEIAAVMENLTMNVDLEARRSAAYPDWAQKRLAAWQAEHDGVALPKQVGAVIGIRRKG